MGRTLSAVTVEAEQHVQYSQVAVIPQFDYVLAILAFIPAR